MGRMTDFFLQPVVPSRLLRYDYQGPATTEDEMRVKVKSAISFKLDSTTK